MVETSDDSTIEKPESESVQDSTSSRTPHAHDVLCGRGGQSNKHPGNEWFRRLVRSNRALYRSCPKHTKLLVAKAIVQAVQQQDPPGRFIKLTGDGKSNESTWEPITYTQAVNKTSQALREKESRDGGNKKKQRQKQQNMNRESLKGINEKKTLENARETSKSVIEKGTKTNVLTNSTVKLGNRSDTANPLEQREMIIGEHGLKHTGPRGDQKNDSRPLGQKRKILDSSQKSQWHIGSTRKAIDTTLGTNGTQESDIDFNKEKGNKRMKVLDGETGNVDTIGIKNHETNFKMGRGVVKQLKTSASMIETPGDAATPFPMETTLGQRQSTLFRFFNSTRIFGREAANGQAQPTALTNSVSQNLSQLTPWAEQESPIMTNNPEFRQDRRSSSLSFSPDERMGMTSVQHLRSMNFPSTSTPNSVAGLEEEMEDMPTSGLAMRGDVGDHDTAPPPPQKGLRTQMSDWLSTFFPPTKRDEPRESGNYTDDTDPGSSSHSAMENDETSIPPPPGGGSSLGRSVSSALFGLVESPSMFLTTLKSGVSSVFGDSVAGESFSPTIRRFPSTFQQMRQHQPQPNFLLQQRGKGSGGGAMLGNHPVLGERAPKRDSLLDDIDETPMEKELRNAKPEEKTRDARFFGKPNEYMPFK
mmetsp:Transcript_11606/g.27635  ORF Transcript_11606/g.27635 Transcript_11606/m.27635 type:complete len:644 (+) Transcript_11606:175-2106(+)